MRTGLARLALRGGRWVADGMVDGIEGETRFMQEDADGALWISQPAGALYRMRHPERDRPTLEAFTEAEGLRVAPGPVVVVEGRLLLVAREGVFGVAVNGRRLVLTRDAALTGLWGTYGVFAPDGKAAWTYDNGQLRSPTGSFQMGGLQPNDLLVLPSGVTYIAASDGLLRYDPRVPLGDRRYPAFIRRVTDRQLNVFYGGAPRHSGKRENDLELEFDQVRGGLRFEYAAGLFDRPGTITFSTRMLGTDDETWSPWTGENVASFIGIREGTYTFEVRGRNDIGQVTEVTSFRVRIYPPWYRSWWAFTLYVGTLMGLVWLYVWWRLRKQRLRLEALRARNARNQRLGARLRDTNVRLRRADKLKDDLLANTSHELRTPLTAVLGFSEVLLDEAEGDARELAEGIQRGGTRLLATVDGLLDMYKLQSGTMETLPQPVDAGEVVRDNVRMLAPLAAQRGLDLRVLPETLSLPAQLDRGVLDRILTHVVGNAVKFTEAGGVTVLADATDTHVVVTVVDTGVGIPEDMTERVFEPFEQASTGYGRSFEGTGLGLAIVRRLIELVGGTVDLESRLGEGTTVRIAVPRWTDLAVPSRRVATAADNPAFGGAHLLALDVGDAVADLRTWVEPRGTVCTTDTPSQAVREARKVAFDAVFVGASTAEIEQRAVALVRNVPGYDLLPVLRVGGEELDAADLAARGFTHQLAVPLIPDDFLVLLEALLMTVEDAADE